MVELYSKKDLIEKFQQLAEMGWVENGRFGNQGGVGNTLEDYLGIAENNLPIPNAGEWELKAQKAKALTTLFHMEPSPRAVRFVPQMFLPLYGWKHQKAGKGYSDGEMSFRQTIHGLTHSDRGFIVRIDRSEKKVLVSFDASAVDIRHAAWLKQVQSRVGTKELDPQPYWGFNDLEYKAGSKLNNCFYAQAEVKRANGKEYYWYNKVLMLEGFNFEGFLGALETGAMFVDIDARSGHNHGTKFRLRQGLMPVLYENTTTIV